MSTSLYFLHSSSIDHHFPQSPPPLLQILLIDFQQYIFISKNISSQNPMIRVMVNKLQIMYIYIKIGYKVIEKQRESTCSSSM
jgi:hypothetical protein